MFSKEQIICKLGDLIKARSTITQIKMTVCNFGARFVNRGSAALLVLEIQIETQLKDSAGINDIKRLTYVHMSLMLTLFLIVNFDLSYRYEYDVKELLNKYNGKTFCVSAEQQ